VWSPERPVWYVGLAAHQVVRVRSRGVWPLRTSDLDSISWTASAEDSLWHEAVQALAKWLNSESASRPIVRVMLSGSLVRWQMLPWRAELTRRQELVAYARLRYIETFGSDAEQWRLMLGLQAPGCATPACAVDETLMQSLQTVCREAGARLDRVVPYFGSAVDYWRKAWGNDTAWFGLIESDWLSLGLSRAGALQALRGQRLDGDWGMVLSGLMARMGVAAGDEASASAKVYLAGHRKPQIGDAEPPYAWLPAVDKGVETTGLRRLALGW